MAMTRDQLAGGWRLVRWSVEYADGRAPETPFGEDAEGLLLYGLDGWMTATMHERHRTRLSHPSVRLATPESRAAAMTEYLSYGGRWRLEGDRVIHDVCCSLNPVLVGTRQVRDATLVEGRLHLTARESNPAGERLHRIVWRREP